MASAQAKTDLIGYITSFHWIKACGVGYVGPQGPIDDDKDPCEYNMEDIRGSLTVIEECRISPPCNTVGDRSLPVTFFDLVWLLQPYNVHQLFAYDFSHSKTHFTQTTIPTLKYSLSITLQHFFPFAGSLIISKGRKPEIRHVEGDSIPLKFAECVDLDFNDLIGNHPRDCNKFYGLVPLLEGGVKVSDDLIKIPLFSVQVTFFPDGNGITIGITNHHILCDASTKFDFLKAWAMIAKSGNDELFLAKGVLPFFDRAIEYPNSLDDKYLNLPIDIDLYKPSKLDSYWNNKVRATIVLTRPQINCLRAWVSSKLPKLEYVSSFSVTCAYVWSCIAKSRTRLLGDMINDQNDHDNELEIFLCVADWRGRLDPPIPQSYFGNFVWPCFAIAKTSTLVLSSGTNGSGFLTAVELLGKAISEKVKVKNGVIKDIEKWDGKFDKGLPTIGVAGTPKLKVYDLDFGWGKPVKYEVIYIDYNGGISVNACRDSPEDIEIGLSLPAKQMDAFIAISKNELDGIF